MKSHDFAWFGAAVLSLVAGLGAPTHADEPESVASSGGSLWGANYFPNVLLTTHEGQQVRFFDDLLKDKVVVINFIYTSCPDICPLETARLTELQEILGDRVGDDVFMYSISIDPDRDTPQVLKEYAERFRVGPGWLFLTGDARDITLLRKKLSLYREEGTNGPWDHNLTLIIGNQATGRWMKRSPYENPYFLANQVGSWLHNWKTPAPNQSSYANAPRLRQLTQGESVFRSRCASCHVIGGREKITASQSARLLGPDLLDVTQRRERAWLERWLREPDKMLAEKDPIAVELYAKHNKVSMPNLSLRDHDVVALLEYMELESERYRKSHSSVAVTEEPEAEGSERPASCCEKSLNAVLGSSEKAFETMESAVVDTEPDAAREKSRTAFLVVSSGLGCVFLLMSIVFGRRGPAVSTASEWAASDDPGPTRANEA